MGKQIALFAQGIDTYALDENSKETSPPAYLVLPHVLPKKKKMNGQHHHPPVQLLSRVQLLVTP